MLPARATTSVMHASITNDIDYESRSTADAKSSLRIERRPHVPLVRAINENYGDCRGRWYMT